MMNRTIVLVVLVVLAIGLAAARKPGKNKSGRREGKGSSDAAATTGDAAWTWAECVPKRGDCGKGEKIGTCSGVDCPTDTASTTAKCRVPCPTDIMEEEEGTASPDAGDVETVTEKNRRRGGKDKTGKAGKAGKGGKARKGGKIGKTDRVEGQERPRKNKPNKPNKPHNKQHQQPGCKYTRPSLSECDPLTNTLNKTRTLRHARKGVECDEVVVDVLRCDRVEMRKENKRCNYTEGAYSPCDPTTNRRSRVDVLSDPTQESEQCRLQRTVDVKCEHNKPVCKYNWEEIACDAETDVKTLTGTLIGAQDHSSTCEPTRTKEASCKPCVFSEWESYTECADGLKSRSRSVERGRPSCRLLAREYVVCE